MQSDLKPTAIVTGSSRGIGAAIAQHLGSLDYNVIINYCTNRDAALKLESQFQSANQSCLVVGADITVAKHRDNLVKEAVNRFGSIDLLVNNAGITSPGRVDLLDSTEESWDQVLATNLKGPYFLAQIVAKQMTANPIQNDLRGTIININSISSFAVSENRGDYCIAKRGMQMMTKLFASRLARDSIRVYEICPGIIESDMTVPVKQKYDAFFEAGMTPIARWGSGHDVARAVALLASGELPYSTGERIHVDGGFHIRSI
ncbi:MAG: 3-ketoacyl-ACP reductase [Planctomycetota bacterium]|nr:3-ketoacyl-ACP reductase [Planctomycetota bacterium]